MSLVYGDILITFINELDRAEETGTDTDDWLELEQSEYVLPSVDGYKEWLINKGIDISTATYADYQEYYAQYESACEDTGLLPVDVYVHRNRGDLEYTLHASYGEFSKSGNSKEDYTDGQSVEIERNYETFVTQAYEMEIREGVIGEVSAEWVSGTVLDIEGKSVNNPPDITATGNYLYWGIKLSGSIKLHYIQGYNVHTLNITPRSDVPADKDGTDLSSLYASTIQAVWAGEPETLELEFPDNDYYCGGGASYTFPDKGCYDLYVYREKCTNIIRDQQLVKVSCD